MKNRYLFKTGFTFLLFCALNFTVYAQNLTVTVGAIQKGKPVLTDLGEAERVLKAGLSSTATVSDISIGYAELEKRYYLLGKISNDPVSGKAVQLDQDGISLYASPGTGIEISCVGVKCSSCMPDIKGWKPRCVCHDNSPPADMECNMISRITVGF
jgi:hypothetical protein